MNIIFFGLPYSSQNRNIARRIAVAAHCSGLSNAERQGLINGTVTIPQLINAHPELAEEITVIATYYFQSAWSLDGGATPGFIIGMLFPITNGVWSRLQAALPTAPAGFRYIRFTYPDGTDFRQATLLESNVPALLGREGARYPGMTETLEFVGLTPYLGQAA